MRKPVFLIFLATVLFNMVDSTVFGQANNRSMFDRNEFGVRRNAFLVAEIGLSAEEAGKFIPLENEFKQKFFEIGQDCRRLTQESQNKRNMTDAEYVKMIDCYLENRLKEAQLEKEYFEKFKKIITPEKICKYQQADTRFTREFVIVRRPSGDRNNENNRGGDRNNNNNRTRR